VGTVTINAPKTPVTEGSSGIAAATLPNVCKMPGPPAPFVPSPLPNIAKSGDSPKGYSKKVTIEGKAVALKGASFGSTGDIASKGTGGGLLSSNTHGVAKFIGPGSFDVKIEGKNVQLLGDAMLNNCGPSGSPPNAATLAGLVQAPGAPAVDARALLQGIATKCDKDTPAEADGKKKSCLKLGEDKHKCCEKEIQEHRAKNPPDGKPAVEGERGYRRPQFDAKGNVRPNADGSPFSATPTGPRPDLAAAFAQGRAAIRAAFAAMKGNCYPDAAILGEDGSKTFVGFKFPCPAGHPSGKGISKGGKKTEMGALQQKSYDALSEATGGKGAFAINP
jgi:hypothetical protein